jgi:uncharacterized radical SAM superfamily Fe-S cluster-containing enzyme
MLQSQCLLKEQELKVVDKTCFACSECGKISGGQILEIDKKVFLKSDCCNKLYFIDSDIDTFRKFYLQFGLHEELKDLKGKSVNEIDSLSSTISLNVTFRCNLSCPICYLNYCKGYWDKKDPTLDQIFDFVKSNKSKVVILCGAEPTLRDDLFDIINFIKKNRKLPVLATNGLKLSDHSYVKKLKKAGLWRVYLQFDGFDSEAYKKLRGKDLLPIKLKALKNLREENIDTSLTSVIGRGINEDQVYNILKFAVNYNGFLDSVTFLGLFNNGVLEDSTLSLSDLYKLLSKYTKLPLEYLEEYKKMKINLFNLIGKLFGKNKQNVYRHLLYDTYYFRVNKKKLNPIFSLGELKKINEMLEKWCKSKRNIVPFSTIKNFREAFKFFGIFARLFLPMKIDSKKMYKTLNPGIIELSLTTPSPYASGTEIFRHNSIVPFVVSSAGDGSKPEITRDQDNC